MISASTTVKNKLKQGTAVTIGYKTLIEYNLNEMVNNINVIPKNLITGIAEIQPYDIVNNKYAFKKYFPYESLKEKNRPEHAGIKYAIYGDISANYDAVGFNFLNRQDYKDPKISSYPFNYRTYIPGLDNKYKYYISNKNKGVRVALEYPKTIFCNKISIKFEIAHGIPSTGNVKLKISGSYTQIISFTNSNINNWNTSTPGVLNLYYNGSSWSTTESSLNTNSYVQITGIELFAATPVATSPRSTYTTQPSEDNSSYIAVIDISPRYVIDITSDILDFEISREASMEQEILPVGAVAANGLRLNLVRYANSTNSGKLRVLEYNKTDSNFSTSASLLYLYKDARVLQYIIVEGEQLLQGTFFMDSWSIDEFGNTNIFCLDGARQLQRTLCPEILCENFSTTAIIRRLLDSIGFTNYSINIDSTATENGITTPRYWWTDRNKTVWEAITELCSDNQMVASFDENNKLQFYTRNYFFSSTRSIETDWSFNYNTSGSTLANLISFSKNQKNAGSQLFIDWTPPFRGDRELQMAPVWEETSADPLNVFSLEKEIPISATTGSYIEVKNLTMESSEMQFADKVFSGYLMINEEIIEYDAARYKYKRESDNTWQEVDIKNLSDLKKYQALTAAPLNENIKFTGKIRIKSRGVFGTNGNTGHAPTVSKINLWTLRLGDWK